MSLVIQTVVAILNHFHRLVEIISTIVIMLVLAFIVLPGVVRVIAGSILKIQRSVRTANNHVYIYNESKAEEHGMVDVRDDFWCNTLIHDLRCICLLHIAIVIESQILTNNEQNQLYSLLLCQRHSFVNTNRYALQTQFNILSLSLLYRATPATFNKETFDNNCSRHNNILFVLRNNHENVIGGFISAGIKTFMEPHKWSIYRLVFALAPDVYDEYMYDPNVFLFRIRSSSNLPPKAYPLRRDIDYCAIYHEQESVTIGAECVIELTQCLCIFDDLEGEIHDYSYGPPSPNAIPPFHMNINEFIGDCQNLSRFVADFKVDALEIFQIFSF